MEDEEMRQYCYSTATVREVLDMLEEAKTLMEDLWWTDETMRWKERADKWPKLARLLDQAIETFSSRVD